MPFDPIHDVDEPGGLSNISFIARKPEPLGTELKVVVDPETGIMIFLEIQRGKTGMADLKYTDTMIKTAACTARLMEGTRSVPEVTVKEEKESEEESDSDDDDDERNNGDAKKDTYYGDAWFGSVDSALAAIELGCHLVCVVKTGHNRYPKNRLRTSWPIGRPDLTLCSSLR